MPNKYPCKCYRCNLDSSRVSSCSYGCSLPHAKKKTKKKKSTGIASYVTAAESLCK